jgi:carboxylesterase
MTLMPGAEPYEKLLDTPEGRRVGILLAHGFTGTPQSMRPWARALEEAGWSVNLPLLPGHGTTWQDMNTTGWGDWYATLEQSLALLVEHCSTVVVAGMSMGGTLALRLTEQYGPAGAKSIGDRLLGTMLVNPSLATERKDAVLLPIAQRFIGSFPGIANDIAKEGARELAYGRLPLKAAYSMRALWTVTRRDLPLVTTPVLLYQSAVDHVVEAVSSGLVLAGIRSGDVSHHVLPRSFHVATLDHDAEHIFTTSVEWIRARAAAR